MLGRWVKSLLQVFDGLLAMTFGPLFIGLGLVACAGLVYLGFMAFAWFAGHRGV